MTKENPENTPLATLLSPWHNNENVIWLASTLRINRNIEKFNFPQKLDAERKKHIVTLCLAALVTLVEYLESQEFRASPQFNMTLKAPPMRISAGQTPEDILMQLDVLRSEVNGRAVLTANE